MTDQLFGTDRPRDPRAFSCTVAGKHPVGIPVPHELVDVPCRSTTQPSQCLSGARYESMRICVVGAVGRANTELAAFDAALVGAGVANFNLIRLSSVIPPGAEVVEVERSGFVSDGGWGDRLYAVYAEQRTSIPGVEVWAGVGWCQDRATGRGLFVEHEGESESAVRGQIAASLSDLQAIRALDLGPVRTRVIGATCVDVPVCALVICGYRSEPW